MREFFGFGGYERTPEGAYSWQHLTFVTGLLAVMTLLAIWLGRKNRLQSTEIKNRVLVWAAFLIDGLELCKILGITVNDLLIEKLAQKACKSAIKSGDKLSQLEIDALLEKLKENIGLKCPHGRPVVIKITRMEIDKWFKRII